MEWKLAGILFIEVKGTFDNVSRNRLIWKINALRVDGVLVRWIRSFMFERRVILVLDGYKCEVVEVETGSPVSPILSAVYLSGIFKEVEKNWEEFMVTSFMGESGWLVRADSVA